MSDNVRELAAALTLLLKETEPSDLLRALHMSLGSEKTKALVNALDLYDRVASYPERSVFADTKEDLGQKYMLPDKPYYKW